MNMNKYGRLQFWIIQKHGITIDPVMGGLVHLPRNYHLWYGRLMHSISPHKPRCEWRCQAFEALVYLAYTPELDLLVKQVLNRGIGIPIWELGAGIL